MRPTTLLGIALGLAACREPPRELTLDAQARSHLDEVGPGRRVERVDVEARTAPGARVEVEVAKPRVLSADTTGLARVTLDLAELHGRPVVVKATAPAEPTRTLRVEVQVERAPGMREEGRGWAVFPKGCHWELDRFKLIATQCERGTVFELLGRRFVAEGPELEGALDVDATIADLPASLTRIGQARTLAVVVTTPTGARYEGAWDKAAFEAEARARLRGAEARAVSFGPTDVPSAQPRAVYFFARGSNAPDLVGRAEKVREVDLVAFEGDGGARSTSCTGVSEPVPVRDSKVEVYDRRAGKLAFERTFRVELATVCKEGPGSPGAFVPREVMIAWLETLTKR